MYRPDFLDNDYYSFVGWAKEIEDFNKVINDEISSNDVRKFILDNVVYQAEQQALHDSKYKMSDGYITFYQQQLEAIATASMFFCRKLIRNNEKDMFIFGPMLGGVYVFKKV